MKSSLYLFSLAVFVFLESEVTQADSTALNYNCNLPYWNAPAESNEGIFTGDLSLDCSLSHPCLKAGDSSTVREGNHLYRSAHLPLKEENCTNPLFNLMNLKKKIIEKVRIESIIHREPASHLLNDTAPLTWDVSHHFEEEGNTIKIRELLTLSIENGNQLRYQTHSKEVAASGMASYLRSVEFTMMITQQEKDTRVSFRNRVQVQRPWYALDLIFAPIARNTCFKKLNQVKEEFMPWIIHALQESPREFY